MHFKKDSILPLFLLIAIVLIPIFYAEPFQETEVEKAIGYESCKEKTADFLIASKAKYLTQKNQVVDKYPYNYDAMVEDLMYLKHEYGDFLDVTVIGKSHWGNNIFAVVLGKGSNSIMINAAHHGREHATTCIVMRMIADYARLYKQDRVVAPYGNTRELLDRVSIHFIPMVNPDGVKISQSGQSSLDTQTKNELEKLLVKGKTFNSWKSNGIGIDPNSNYPAKWERETPYLSEGGSGEYPGQAFETKALMDYTKKNNFLATISYHNSGEVLYWYFFQDKEAEKRDYELTKQLSNLTGYRPLPKFLQVTSNSGYKDWFVQEFKKPGWTIEIGSPSCIGRALPKKEMLKAWKKNRLVGLWLCKSVI